MDIQKAQLTIITALAAAQVLHEALDDLENTSFYRQSLKATTKRMQAELTKTCDNQIATMYGIDETVMNAIQEGIIEISKEIAKMDPVQIALLGDGLKDGSLKFVKK